MKIIIKSGNNWAYYYEILGFFLIQRVLFKTHIKGISIKRGAIALGNETWTKFIPYKGVDIWIFKRKYFLGFKTKKIP